MTRSEAQAEVFMMAFSALSRGEKRSVLTRMMDDSDLRHDLMDIAVIEARCDEPERSFREYLDEKHVDPE